MNKPFPLTGHHIAFALYYGMRILVGVAVIRLLLAGNWEFAFYSTLVFLAMVVPSALKEIYRIYLPFELDLALVALIFSALFLGDLNGFYERFTWWDGMLHFLSGILAGIVGFLLVYVLNASRANKLQLSPGFIVLFSFTFSLAIAVLWEIFEFGADVFVGSQLQESGWPDTMGDLTLATVGALIVASIGYGWILRRQQVPFTPGLLAKLQYRGRPSKS